MVQLNWVSPAYLRKVGSLKKDFKSAKPFPHIVLPNFFKNAKSLKSALLKEKFHYQNSDLFQFHQTNDCSKAKTKIVQDFHKFFGSNEFLDFISEITGKKLTSIDMSGFVYGDTDYLLPHDDRLEGRKIAYVVNLSENFKEENGGALALFKGKKIVKRIVPKFNTLTIFEVSNKSLHEVEEVIDKKRVSFAGWFHG
jgi:Rps23 Pro-64 3,4-dihydroxylase Tpa1-like proline 4-hydroxylase